MEVKIDVNGNININGEASATPQYALLLFLRLVADGAGETLEYDQESQIKDVEYDAEADRLSWSQFGSEQSYSFNSPTLVSFITEACHSLSPEATTDLLQRRDEAYFAMAANAAEALELCKSYSELVGQAIEQLKAANTAMKNTLQKSIKDVEAKVGLKGNQAIGTSAAAAALSLIGAVK